MQEKLHIIPFKTEIIQQIGIDICRLPKVDSLKHLVVCKDYFSKWSEEKCIKDKSASIIAQFLYEIIHRYGCMKIQISDQGREFVNEIRKGLNNIVSTKQWIKRLKDSLMKILDGNHCNWPNIIKGVLFANRVSKIFTILPYV